MKTPERLTALCKAKETLRMRDQRLARMKKQLETVSLEKGITVDTQLQEEIEGVISERNSEIQSLPSSDFMKIFWEQQVCHSFHKYMYSLVVWIRNFSMNI